MKSPADRPHLIVVPHSASRFPVRIALPIAVLSAAMFGLILRAASPNWRGLWEEAGECGRSFFASKPKAAKPRAPALAKAEVSRPSAPAEKAKPAPEPTPKAAAAWDAIKRDAEKAQAERDEAESLKEKAVEELANTPPPPSIRHGQNGLNPAVIAEMQRRHAEMVRQMDALMGDQHRRFDEIVRSQNERQARMMNELTRRRRVLGAAPGFGNFGPPLPGMDRMVPPLPGMDRMVPPLPGQPRIHEESGEEVRDGMRRTWRTRIVVIGGG